MKISTIGLLFLSVIIFPFVGGGSVANAHIFGGVHDTGMANQPHLRYDYLWTSWTRSGHPYSKYDEDVSDPINLVFFYPSRKKSISAARLVDDGWIRGRNMDPVRPFQLLGADTPVVCVTEQTIFFETIWEAGPSGVGGGWWLTSPVAQEANLASSVGGCFNQWHMRLWSSKKHRRGDPSSPLGSRGFHPNVKINPWSIGAVHWDKYVGPDLCEFTLDPIAQAKCIYPFFSQMVSKCIEAHACHARGHSFEQAEHKAAVELRDDRCVKRNWKKIPGSEGSGTNYSYSNGAITYISGQRYNVFHPEHCRIPSPKNVR